MDRSSSARRSWESADPTTSDVPIVTALSNTVNAVVEKLEQDPYREDGGEG
jgi:hypothetical protein